jgi:3-deoxy-D-manno-octulosonic-acid transferase
VSYLVYNLLLWIVCVLGSPVWLVLVLARRKWRAGILERLGFVPPRIRPDPSGKPVLWLHAVSVGEVLAAVPLIRLLQSSFQLYVSTTTLTGQALARQRFGADHVFYFPLDLSFAVQRYLSHLHPKLVIMLETEFWPNFLRGAHAHANVAVVNARISDRSLPGYRRYKSLLRKVLSNVNLFLAQSHEDARRLVEIGAPSSLVRTSGNIKFDWTPPAETPAIVQQLKQAIHSQQRFPVIIAGSTVAGEESLVIAAFESVLAEHPHAFLILAPRHPERFDAVADELTSSGLAHARRSQTDPRDTHIPILLLDSIGELAAVYELADIAFVGGSLVPRGGHNILEPAYFAKPITVGTYTENFRDIVREFRANNAVLKCPSTALVATWLRLASDSAERVALGNRARDVVSANTGATQRTADALIALAQAATASAASSNTGVTSI